MPTPDSSLYRKGDISVATFDSWQDAWDLGVARYTKFLKDNRVMGAAVFYRVKGTRCTTVFMRIVRPELMQELADAPTWLYAFS